MFGWIENLFRRGASAVGSAIMDVVHAAIRGLYSFLHDIFNGMWYAWADMYDGGGMIYRGLVSLARSSYQAFIKVFRHWIPALFKGIDDLYHWALKIFDVTRHLVLGWIDNLYHWTLATFDAVRKWAIANIFNPLLKSLLSAWHWLTHEGATMWHYFTHLSDLAELLFWHLIQSLERHAWDAAKLLGRFMLALIVRNLMTFVTLMEDIIDAVL